MTQVFSPSPTINGPRYTLPVEAMASSAELVSWLQFNQCAANTWLFKQILDHLLHSNSCDWQPKPIKHNSGHHTHAETTSTCTLIMVCLLPSVYNRHCHSRSNPLISCYFRPDFVRRSVTGIGDTNSSRPNSQIRYPRFKLRPDGTGKQSTRGAATFRK